jgi:NADPH-dependent 2,4-dienoyl-CoA reductase/sulfur reductase-like enzyme
MPIKCAGAPQKAMYLSADHWRRKGVLKDIQIDFCNAGAVLFGVADYVPALMEYVKRYGISLNFAHTLTAIDGPGKTATFSKALPDGSRQTVVKAFDMIHVVTPLGGSMWTRQHFATRSTKTSTHWETQAIPPTRRPQRQPASKRRWSHTTC